MPATPAVQEAKALEGTTDYSVLFSIQHWFGSPGVLSGNTLRFASTLSSSHYTASDAYTWSSSSEFITKKPISLLHDWTVSFEANVPL